MVRIASFELDGRSAFGVVTDDGVHDLSGGPADDLVDAVTSGDDLARRAGTVPTVDAAAIAWLPPVPNPARILCVGLNYRDHAEESATIAPSGDRPTIFTRFASSVVGHERPLLAPTASDTFDYEGEVVVVIGRRGRNIAVDEALDHVLGLTPFMDGSVREFQRHTSQFTPGKNFDDSGASGPWITTLDEIDDLDAVTVTTRVDGEVRQHAPLGDLITPIPEIIAYCSSFTTLEPGDVIATGTPGGVGVARDPALFLRPGMTVEVEVSAVGTLHNPVVASP
ncbi:MAG: fumarylacetoacetate hydrolase family protein [Actinomycetota bacterium]